MSLGTNGCVLQLLRLPPHLCVVEVAEGQQWQQCPVHQPHATILTCVNRPVAAYNTGRTQYTCTAIMLANTPVCHTSGRGPAEAAVPCPPAALPAAPCHCRCAHACQACLAACRQQPAAHGTQPGSSSSSNGSRTVRRDPAADVTATKHVAS
jgi:hypothetical protein